MAEKKREALWAVVTGATGGIGPHFCRRLAEMGYNIVLVSERDGELASEAAEIRKEYGVDARPLTLDLAQKDSPRILMSWLEENWIRPSVCINNAGIFSFREATKLSSARRDLFVMLHVRAVTEISVLMASAMKAAGIRGHILNMSSMSCWMPMPGISMYSATKAYIRVFSRALRYEVRDDGISVTVACPGGIATDLFGLPDNLKKLAVRIGAISTPERFTRGAVKRMLAGKPQYINGLLNHLAIFFVAITPLWARMLVKHKMLDKGISR